MLFLFIITMIIFCAHTSQHTAQYTIHSAANCYKGCKWSRMRPLVLSQEPEDQSILRLFYAIFTGCRFDSGSRLRQQFWSTSVCTAWLHSTFRCIASRRQQSPAGVFDPLTPATNYRRSSFNNNNNSRWSFRRPDSFRNQPDRRSITHDRTTHALRTNVLVHLLLSIIDPIPALRPVAVVLDATFVEFSIAILAIIVHNLVTVVRTNILLLLQWRLIRFVKVHRDRLLLHHVVIRKTTCGFRERAIGNPTITTARLPVRSGALGYPTPGYTKSPAP